MNPDWRVAGLQKRLPGHVIESRGYELYVDGIHIRGSSPLDSKWVGTRISEASDGEMLDGLAKYVSAYLARQALSYQSLLDTLKAKDADVHSLFRVGSRVYGCATEASDDDFLAVLHRGKQDLVFRPGINITLHTVETFQKALDGHSMFALECLFSPKETRLKDGPAFPFKLDRTRLIAKVTETSESDWKKALKLWDFWGRDFWTAQKKLYHSIRVLLFARQILQHGRIVDFGEANPVWAAIQDSAEWEPFESQRKALLETFG